VDLNVNRDIDLNTSEISLEIRRIKHHQILPSPFNLLI